MPSSRVASSQSTKSFKQGLSLPDLLFFRIPNLLSVEIQTGMIPSQIRPITCDFLLILKEY
jgi:hypothetical protein